MKIKTHLFILTACLLLLSSICLQAEYWQKITNLPNNVSNQAYWLDVYFLESAPNYGWICGKNTNQVLRTTDGGNSWEVSNFPRNDANFTESIHFADQLNGFASGPSGVYRTSDGGINWESISYLNDQLWDGYIDIWGCYMLSKDTVYVVGGGCNNDTDPRLIWRSVNGGDSWSSYDLGILKFPPPYDPDVQEAPISDIIVHPNGVGYVAGSGMTYKTTDFGNNWEMLSLNNDGSRVWQEEITNIRGTRVICTPYANTSNCGDVTFDNGGGMIWTNNETSWSQYNVNAHMYGTFLVSETEGWACGNSSHVFRTLDGGKTWDTTNCGIEDEDDLDDIRFVSKGNGWVVGANIYRTAPTDAFVLNENVAGSICATGAFLDTNRIVISTYNKAHFTFTVLDNSPYFRIITPRANTTLDASACSSSDFIVEFATQTADPVGIVGTHEIAVEIEGTFENETTTWTDTVYYTIEVTPYDVTTSVDTLDLGTIILGSTVIGTVDWFTSSDATIELESRTGNDNNEYCVLSYPVGNWYLSTTQQNEMEFTVTPVLTGEYLVRYNFIVLPCNLEKSVYVKFNVEGLELETQPDYTIDMICTTDTVLAIPISNNGELPVMITDVFHDDSEDALTPLGFGTPIQLSPFIILAEAEDTLFIEISSQTMQDFIDTVWLEVRDTGNVSPSTLVPVSIDVNFLYPSVASQTTVLDFGDVCINRPASRTATIRYNGTLVATFSQTDLTQQAFRLTSNKINTTQPNTDLLFDIDFTPTEVGSISDTIRFTTTPCNYTFELIVTGRGVLNDFEYSPANMDQILNAGESANFSFDVTSLSSDPITVTSISVLPASPEISLQTAFPFALNPQETAQIEFTAFSNVGKIVTCSLLVVCNSACADTLLLPVRIEFVNTKVAYKNSEGVDIYSIDNSQQCSFTKRYDTIFLTSVSDFVLHNVSLLNNSPEFTIESNLSLPDNILANVPYPVIISTEQTAFGSASNNLLFELENELSSVTWVDTLPITSNLNGSSLTISQTEFDFGMFETCNIPIYHTFTIKNNGNIADTCYIDVSNIPDCINFSATRIVIEGNDSASITITCEPGLTTPVTNYFDSVSLHSTVCTYQQYLKLKYHSDSIAINVVPTSIDLGEIWAHTAQTTTLTISNPSPFDIEITSIDVAPAEGFSIGIANFPFILQSGTSVDVPVSFISAIDGTFNASINIVAARQCKINLDVPIKAFVPVEQYLATIEWNRITAFPGQTISLEATVTNAASPSVFPTALDFYIKLDYSMFYPTRLLVVNDENTFEEINFSLDINNGIRVQVANELASNLLNTERTIFKLEGQVLISTITQTPVWFDQFNINSDKFVSLSLLEGLLQIPDLCASDDMLGDLTFAPTFSATIEKQVVQEALNVEFSTNGNMVVNYVVVDLLGNDVLLSHVQLSEGNTEWSIDLSSLSAGIYFIKFSSDFNYPLSNCILITK